MRVLLAVLREPKLCSVGGSSSIKEAVLIRHTHVSDLGPSLSFFPSSNADARRCRLVAAVGWGGQDGKGNGPSAPVKEGCCRGAACCNVRLFCAWGSWRESHRRASSTSHVHERHRETGKERLRKRGRSPLRADRLALRRISVDWTIVLARCRHGRQASNSVFCPVSGR